MLSSCTVYPRWRGEHSSWPSIWKRSTGLSAGAGNTIICLVARSVDAVYSAGAGEHTSVTVLAAPATGLFRWRGEHAKNTVRRWYFDGLSPLARGTLPVTSSNLSILRFIPLARGNTGSAESTKPSLAGLSRWRGEPARLFRGGISVSGLSAGAGNTKDILLFYNSFFKHTTIYQLYHNNLTLLKNIQLIDFQREGMKPVVGHLNLPVYGGFSSGLKTLKPDSLFVAQAITTFPPSLSCITAARSFPGSVLRYHQHIPQRGSQAARLRAVLAGEVEHFPSPP